MKNLRFANNKNGKIIYKECLRMKIIVILELKYANTNTYLIKGSGGYILWDTGWAGTFPDFCRALGKINVSIREIKYILLSHFHPDHMGIAQNIAGLGPQILVFPVQKDYVHFADSIFKKEAKYDFLPIEDGSILSVSFEEGKELLGQMGLQAEILGTPGHSDDSISLCLNSGEVFVGDLNPLYELELHKGTIIEESWKKILSRKPKIIYYGHAKTAKLDKEKKRENTSEKELYSLVKTIIRLIQGNKQVEVICRKTGAGKEFVEDVMRMYLTHPGVSVQGILDRIEIKGR